MSFNAYYIRLQKKFNSMNPLKELTDNYCALGLLFLRAKFVIIIIIIILSNSIKSNLITVLKSILFKIKNQLDSNQFNSK